MTDIFTPEGTLDHAAAASALSGARSLTNAEQRQALFAQITAAALVDVAHSLGHIVHNLIVIGEQLGAFDDVEREVGPDGEPLDPDPERPIEVGDYVLPIDSEYNEFVDPFRVAALGVSEDRAIATLDNGNKVWLDHIARVELDDPADEFDGTETEHDLGRDGPDDGTEDLDPGEPSAPDPKGRCDAPYRREGVVLTDGRGIPTVTCARKPLHDGKHRKGNLKWTDA